MPAALQRRSAFHAVGEGRERHSDEVRIYPNLDKSVLFAHGFKPIAEEWWHFTLANEPYPDTYFDFPVR